MDRLSVKTPRVRAVSKALKGPYAKVIGLVLLVALPFLITDQYKMHVIDLVLYYVLLAVSLDIQAGFLGMLSLGQAGFIGIGAYTSALLLIYVFHGWWGFWLSMLAGGVAAGLAGLIVGLPTLRIRGDYLAMVTLGFGEIVRYILLNWIKLTHGPVGLTGVPSPRILSFTMESRGQFYWLILALTAITILLVLRLKHSYIGRAWIAIREDELAAQSTGVNITYYKVLAFVISGFMAGVAGAFLASYLNYIAPSNFLSMESLMILCMVVLGGAATVWGPALGAAILTVVPEVLRPIAEYRMLAFGLVMVLFMLFKPKGLLGK